MNQSPHVVFMNLAQCFTCGRTIPPTAEVRRRRMQTGDAYRHGMFGGREEQYGLVALCISCDDAIEAEEQKWRVQRTKGVFALVGILGMSLFLLNLGVPWWSALLAALLLAFGGVLWWSIATWAVICAALAAAGVPLENNLALLPYFGAGVGVTILAKGVERQRRQRGEGLPLQRQDKPG